MIKKKKVLETDDIPEFDASIAEMPLDSKIFVEKSLDIAHYIFRLLEEKDMNQKDLAVKLVKTEAEISKWLGGMHNYTLRSLSKIEAALGEIVICVPKSYNTVRLIYTPSNNGTVFDQDIHGEYAKLTYTDCKVVNLHPEDAQKEEELIEQQAIA